MDSAQFILHDVERGWRRLHHAPKDVRGTMPNHLDTPAHLACRPGFTALHKLYLDDLGPSVDMAIEWWQHIVEHHLQEGETVGEAALKAYSAWPAGPAGGESVVSVVRTYWLACAEQVARLPPEEGMFPEDFLLATLDRKRHERAVLVLTAMPYWPIGLDATGRWC